VLSPLAAPQSRHSQSVHQVKFIHATAKVFSYTHSYTQRQGNDTRNGKSGFQARNGKTSYAKRRQDRGVPVLQIGDGDFIFTNGTLNMKIRCAGRGGQAGQIQLFNQIWSFNHATKADKTFLVAQTL